MNEAVKRVSAADDCDSVSASYNSSVTDKTNCNDCCGYSPIIVLPGINHSPTYLYDENGEPVMFGEKHIGGTLLFPNKAAFSGNAVKKLIAKALAAILTQTDLEIGKNIYNLVSDALKYQRCDNEGNHIENLRTKRWNYSLAHMTEDEIEWVYRMVPMKSLVDEIGEDHVYFFTFNLVGDPLDSADDLNNYIKLVKKQTGHKKVTLLPISLGGTILTSYLDKYGHSSIDKVVNVVACLDGTDIVADMFARDWRLDDKYLYHEFFKKIFLESKGTPTLGYVLNSLLHMLPRCAVDAFLSGAISAVLDTLMVNCPQFWAMLPSYRYQALADRYLADKPVLKARTDAFQKARLALKNNIVAAAADGVCVDFIAGANLDFGEQMYTYFNIVSSAEKVNSDGIVNLNSATLGAIGFVKRENNISPDNLVDVSTAVLPENTWVFLNQHHEVGRSDVVLNLIKAIILGEVKNVNDDPIKYPQFNGPCCTHGIRRWKLPDAKRVDQTTLSRENSAELNAAITECEKVLSLTVADSDRCEAAEERLVAILRKIGAPGYERNKAKKTSAFSKALESVACAFSKGSLLLFGGGSCVDRIKKLLKFVADEFSE